jgi:macrolide-specific efflux system membrane fusion protein
LNFRRGLTPWRIGGAVVVLLVLGLMLRGCFKSPEPPAITTTAVTRGDLEMNVLATGTIEAARLVSVGAQATGEVKRLYVALGDKVRKGDPIAEIDSKQQDNDLLKARAALQSARADLGARKAALKQAELAATRLRALVAIDAGSHVDLEVAEANVDSARAAVTVAESAIAQATLAEDTARVNVGYAHVVAPMDGTVVAIVTEQGQTVNAVQISPTIIKLARLETMTVKAQISEADVPRVKAGMPVYFTLLGDPDTRYDTTLRAVEPGPTTLAADTGANTAATSSAAATAIYYNGIFDVPNPQGKLRISMTAQATIVLDKVKDQLLVPSAALGPKRKDGRQAVRVVSEAAASAGKGLPQERLVRIGLNNRVQAQVLEGLKAGERVVTSEAPTPAGAASAASSASGADGTK